MVDKRVALKLLAVIAIIGMVAIAGCSVIDGDNGNQTPTTVGETTTQPAVNQTTEQTTTVSEITKEDFNFPAGLTENGIDSSTYHDGTFMEIHSSSIYEYEVNAELRSGDQGATVTRNYVTTKGEDYAKTQVTQPDGWGEDITYVTLLNDTSKTYEKRTAETGAENFGTTQLIPTEMYTGYARLESTFAAGMFQFENVERVNGTAVANYTFEYPNGTENYIKRVATSHRFNDVDSVQSVEGTIKITEDGHIYSYEHTVKSPDVEATTKIQLVGVGDEVQLDGAPTWVSSAEENEKELALNNVTDTYAEFEVSQGEFTTTRFHFYNGIQSHSMDLVGEFSEGDKIYITKQDGEYQAMLTQPESGTMEVDGGIAITISNDEVTELVTGSYSEDTF